VVRPDVAGVARLWLAGLLLAELVTQVALLALADGAIRRGRADVVATLAGELGDGRPLDCKQGVAHLVGGRLGLGDRPVNRKLLIRQPFQADHGNIRREAVAAGVELCHLRLMAGLTHGGGRRGQHIRPLMLNRAGVVCGNLVTVLAGDIRCCHRAAAILGDNPRRRLPVAAHAFVVAPRQGVHLRFAGNILANRHNDQRKAQDDGNGDHADDKDPPGSQAAAIIRRTQGIVVTHVTLLL